MRCLPISLCVLYTNLSPAKSCPIQLPNRSLSLLQRLEGNICKTSRTTSVVRHGDVDILDMSITRKQVSQVILSGVLCKPFNKKGLVRLV